MPRNFVLIATQRSGTTAFRACLNTHPGIHMYGEAFFPGLFDWGFYKHFADRVTADPEAVLPKNREATYQGYLDHLVSGHAGKAVGLDTKYSDIDANPGLLGALASRVPVAIHMRRKNLLRTVLSNVTMQQRIKDKVISEAEIHSSKIAPRVRVTLDVGGLVAQLDHLSRQMLRFDRVLEERFQTVLRVNYEDAFIPSGDVTRLASPYDRQVRDMLVDGDPGPFECALKKQNVGALDELIENFDAVREVLDNSRYFYLLD